MASGSNWVDYYRSIAGRAPRPLLLAALSQFPDGGVNRQSVDVGCGDGTETLLLLWQGWRVLAIDREQAAIELLRSRLPEDDQARLETQVAAYGDARFIPADLIIASYSLPFCAPEDFSPLWRNLTGALQPGGVLACHLFGERDSWAQPAEADDDGPDLGPMTFHTTAAVDGLLADLEVIFLREFEDDKPTLGGGKHWHVFEIIARKPGQP